MSLSRTFKALGLAIALFATTHAVSALPTYTYCCSRGCDLVLLSQCTSGAWRTEAICIQNCFN